MQNDYGVFKTNEYGSVEWVTNEMPLELGPENDAINNWSFDAAITVATYLTNTEGVAFAPGRPKRTHV